MGTVYLVCPGERVPRDRKTDLCPLVHMCTHKWTHVEVHTVGMGRGQGWGSGKATLQKRSLKEGLLPARPGRVRSVPRAPAKLLGSNGLEVGRRQRLRGADGSLLQAPRL